MGRMGFRRFACVLAMSLVAATSHAQAGLRTLTPGQMQDDLFQLSEAFASLHSGLQRYATPQELDEVFGEALHQTEEERDAVEFYRLICEAVAAVHCGHTRALLPGADRRAALERKGVLPFEVHLDAGRAWVRRKLDDSLPIDPGTEILSIDGMAVEQILAAAYRRLPADGWIETGKERQLEADFPALFVILVDDFARYPRGYSVGIAGRAEALEVSGIPAAEYERRRSRRSSRPVVDLEIDENRGFGLLSISEFGDPPSPEPSFPEALAAGFRRLRESGVRSLVLDLRGNGGGSDEYGALLVSYMADEPFGYFDRIEVTADYTGDVEVVERDGKRLMLSHSGLRVQEPAELRFDGEIYILVDGWTFSTAADVATVAHHNGLATFIGDETGGGYDGNNSGDSDTVVLTNSGFPVRRPKWMYVTANAGHAFPGRGVIPDHAARPTVADVLAGRDVELEKALELIRASAGGR